MERFELKPRLANRSLAFPFPLTTGGSADFDSTPNSEPDRAGFLARIATTLCDGSPVRRHRRFFDLLDQMQPGDAIAIRKQLAATMDQGILYEDEWEAFWTRWGEIAGPEAIKFILTKQNHDAVSKDLRRVMRGWGAKDAASASQWLNANQQAFAENKKDLADALIGLADGFGSTDLPGATRMVLQAAPAGDPILGSLMETLAEQAVRQGRADAVASWFDQLPADSAPGGARRAAMGHVYWRLYQASADRALDFLREQASQPWRSDKLIAELAGRVAEKDPAKALGWLETIPPATDGSFPGLQNALATWTKSDSPAAARWLDGLAAGPFRDRAVAAAQALQLAPAPNNAGR